jgi:hypothetical protein
MEKTSHGDRDTFIVFHYLGCNEYYLLKISYLFLICILIVTFSYIIVMFIYEASFLKITVLN